MMIAIFTFLALFALGIGLSARSYTKRWIPPNPPPPPKGGTFKITAGSGGKPDPERENLGGVGGPLVFESGEGEWTTVMSDEEWYEWIREKNMEGFS